MQSAGVPRSDGGPPGQARPACRIRGACPTARQASGLVVLLVIVTVLARRLSVAELGAYGLVASLAGYLLVLRNSVASSACGDRRSFGPDERGLMFSAAAALYLVVGVVTGVLIALAALAIGSLILDGELGGRASGGAGLGLVTAIGIAASVNLDALRAERLFVRSGLTEITAVSSTGADARPDPGRGRPGLGGGVQRRDSLPGGDFSAVVARRSGVPWLRHGRGDARARHGDRPDGRLAARRGALDPRDVRVQPRDPGRYRSPAAVGQFEGPVRAHNLLYALGGALAVPVVPTASRYVAAGDARRLRGLAVRGTRYTLALFVPLCGR